MDDKKRRNHIHVTERADFKTCRRMWKYRELWGLRPNVSKTNLIFGTAVHKALEEKYKGIQRGKPILAEQLVGIVKMVFKDETKESVLTFEDKQELTEALNLACSIVLRYDEYYQKKDYTKSQIIAVEEEFKERIPGTRFYLCGKVDLVIKNKAGKPAPVDHKTFKQLVSEQHLYLDDQMTAYQWLLMKRYGVVPGSAEYNQIRKSIPKIPELLKDGTRLSKAAIDTTWTIYRNTVLEHGFDPSDYVEMQKKLEGNIYFTRSEAPRTKKELLNFEEQLVAEAREMCSPKTFLFPHQDWDCTWRCDFTALCKCESEGGDVRALANALYIRKGDQ